MKIDITKEEYRLLLDILSISDWVMNATRVEADSETAPYAAQIGRASCRERV